jgi:outer membrane protein OmpA-like peptidoglycan-associated protein
MSMRVLLIGVFGLSATVIGTDVEAPLTTNRVEACGVKVAVKAAPPKRSLRRTARRSEPIQRGGSRVAVRTRIDTKSERTPIAAGRDRQARAATDGVKRPVSKPKLRTKPKTERTPKQKEPPKQERLAKVEPEPEIQEVPEPEPEPEPESSAADPAVSTELFFETGVYDLSSDAEAELQEVVEWLKANPKGKVVIEGHTDPVGSTARNRQLSIKRGKAVQAFLSSAAGVSSSRLQVKGYGETKLRYPRNSPKNRRVVVKTR